MGAFTDDLDVLENLFQSKIPVYYIRSLSRAGDVRIDSVANFIEELNGKIDLHSGFVVDTSDETPSHRVIFTGLARNPERYLSMAKYMVSLFEYPSVLGTEQPKNSTSMQKARLSITSPTPIRQTSIKSTRGRPAPCMWFGFFVRFGLIMTPLNRFQSQRRTMSITAKSEQFVLNPV
ncbi:hypothetical protein K435DRAFT_693533 [Dendrothele bispora CBS 962.96]|uniref:Uncharacterized protein n=1 Tax=Dendrothele bispora (strain CBS 962.96) TaxID=1314807 RepID=A0A4V4HC09_DENBC|nr:hypothetical protein K435DRAFT_693533 [Dendrothele bispora CBS 962.96]